MCGIAGIALTDGSTPGPGLLTAMTDTLRHRGPDGEGVGTWPGCGFGHRRLSIIDLAGGAQPMADAAGRYWVTFNGEIYNYPDLKAGLSARGRHLRTRSDTEVLVNLIAEHWREAVPMLRGMYAFGAWDMDRRRLLLARDRIGKKPLYWFEDAQGLYFASEIKALLTLPQCPRAIDPQAVDRYLAFQSIPGTGTIFRGVHRLPPASTLEWTAGQPPRIDVYWTPDWTQKTRLSYEDAKRQLRDLILDATRARLLADVPLGAFLSGGVDSSVVVAAMAASSSGPIKTFSIGFPQKDFDETRYARMVAERFGTTHEEFIVEPRAVDVLPKLAWHYDQPYADSSALPTYYVSQVTSQRVTVALNGDGGDEWFGGYERYRAISIHDTYRTKVPSSVRALVEAVARRLPSPTGRQGWLRKAQLFARAAASSPAAFNLGFFSQREFDASARGTLYTTSFAAELGSSNADDYLVALMGQAELAGLDAVDQALSTDTRMYLPDTLLVKVDIASMAVSLEARSPLLDTAVMEFAASLPSAWKVNATENKKILKAAYEDILPRDVLYRRKMGFSLPLAHWFRHELRDYVREILLDTRTAARGYFRPDAVARLIDDHQAGRANHSARLWALLMFEHWHREILDGSASHG